MMMLLTKANRKALPKLYATEEQGDDAMAVVKFFDPSGSWTWFAVEYDGDDTFFGLVDGFELELGYFSLSELKSVRGKLGLGIERDRYFTPTSIGELKRKHSHY
jgi:hypothetical protein